MTVKPRQPRTPEEFMAWLAAGERNLQRRLRLADIGYRAILAAIYGAVAIIIAAAFWRGTCG